MNIRVAKSSDLDGILPLVQSVWTSVKSSLDLYLQFSDMDNWAAEVPISAAISGEQSWSTAMTVHMTDTSLRKS